MTTTVREIAEAKLAEKRTAEGKPAEPKTRPKRVERSADDGPSPFDLANAVDTVSLLDHLGIDHREDGKHELVVCPGCHREGPIGCRDGGIRCLFAACADGRP